MGQSRATSMADLVLVKAGGRPLSFIVQFHRNLSSTMRNILHCQESFPWVKRQTPTALVSELFPGVGEFIRLFPYGRMSSGEKGRF